MLHNCNIGDLIIKKAFSQTLLRLYFSGKPVYNPSFAEISNIR